MTDPPYNYAAQIPKSERDTQIFPLLTPAQMARIIAGGKRVQLHKGAVLAEPGTRPQLVMLVLSGSIDIVLPGLSGETLVVVHGPGSFSGEMSSLRGTGSVARVRVSGDGEAIEVTDAHLREIMLGDPDLSELFMRAFILRRVRLIGAHANDVVLIGSENSVGTLRLQQFLTRNTHPFVNLDPDHDLGVDTLMRQFNLHLEDLPVVLCRGQQVLIKPSNAEVADCLGMNPESVDERVRDVIIVGAGPAGLAAGVYAASEGLDVLIVEAVSPGGQAGSSSKIENYLGFPTGISGLALAGRAHEQARKFGAEIRTACNGVRLDCDNHPFGVELSRERTVRARCIIVATGASYRKIDVLDCDRYLDRGIYYAATATEARRCDSAEVIVVGGGNSAGQAAMFLSRTCRHVHLVVRGISLAASMSKYLIHRIRETTNITLHASTELIALEGDPRLSSVTWRTGPDGLVERYEIGHVFLMTGAVPNTAWLAGCVELDEQQFIRTGGIRQIPDPVSGTSREQACGMFETSIPGVFAIGDVRSGSVKRVAAAVGEGAACIQLVHSALAATSTTGR